MTSLALSTLLYVRDKASEPKRTMNMSATASTTSSRDPFEKKLMRTLDEVLQSKPAEPQVPNNLMVKEKKNIFWRQFVISKTAFTGHR
ncbi:hypothetical protein P3T76_004094 [Phytophthora citrophthora]|uniref:Uncharacterized protein n=1 Tax=Phytophthora citrophthora TaxID=4793 RepID=A0AAD9LR18_9STRA|nr:hypothetical protein P3T76_004094 [Phytophthora citrophthora]